MMPETMTRGRKQRGGHRPGAGRPKTYEQLGPPISVRLESVVQSALEEKCRSLQITRTAGLQQAVARWVRGKR
jgi:hypothetical protein